jgi:hypothetical protein
MTSQSAAREGDPCRKCGTKMRSLLCVPCYGTGKSRGRACKSCGGSGVMIGCPNFRAHTLWPWARRANVSSSSEVAKRGWWNWNYGMAGKSINPFRRGK